jgi:hypothetical protein
MLAKSWPICGHQVLVLSRQLGNLLALLGLQHFLPQLCPYLHAGKQNQSDYIAKGPIEEHQQLDNPKPHLLYYLLIHQV